MKLHLSASLAGSSGLVIRMPDSCSEVRYSLTRASLAGVRLAELAVGLAPVGFSIDQAIETYKKNTGVDPATIHPNSRHGRLLRAMMAAIGEVMDANQSTINAKGIGFKAFIPAVFGRLVGESFARLASGEAELKVTAPPELVRNRKARPDSFEENIIKTKLVEPAWPRGQPYSEMTDAKGRPAYRVMVPEYYAASCLTCHGSPKGEMDITGYPKEGAKQDDLGGVISITLYRAQAQ